LSAQELRAVAAAEAFIRLNGYTDQPPDLSFVKWDLAEAGLAPQEALRMRRNTVLGKAFGLSRNRGSGRAGWTVYFEYHPDFLKSLPRVSDEPRKATGRAVEVSPDLAELEIPHMDIFLSTAEMVFRTRPLEVEGDRK